MQCVTCGSDCGELKPGQKFCGKCGHAGSDHAGWTPAAETTPAADMSPVVEVAPAAPPMPAVTHAPAGRYQAEISRSNPGCLVFLVDHSGSMDEPIAGATGLKKKEAVADAINRLLNELVLRCARAREIYHYFDVGVWTYGGRNDIRPLFAGDLISIGDVEQRASRREKRSRRVSDGAGGVYNEDIELSVWLEPAATGETPMKGAFQAALGPVRQWVAAHPSSFPPVVIHITDGHYTGDNPAPVVSELMQLGTIDGQTLVFNCHISREDRPEELFPGDSTAAAYKGPQRELYDLSSVLPPMMAQSAADKGYPVESGGRGYVYNARNVTLIDFLEIGTQATKDRVEVA